jgi:hypothetical protein
MCVGYTPALYLLPFDRVSAMNAALIMKENGQEGMIDLEAAATITL